jgi:hypothetical protein
MTPEHRHWFWKGYLAGRRAMTRRLHRRAACTEAGVLSTDLEDLQDELRDTELHDATVSP